MDGDAGSVMLQAPSPSPELSRNAAALALAGLRMAAPPPTDIAADDGSKPSRKRRGGASGLGGGAAGRSRNLPTRQMNDDGDEDGEDGEDGARLLLAAHSRAMPEVDALPKPTAKRARSASKNRAFPAKVAEPSKPARAASGSRARAGGSAATSSSRAKPASSTGAAGSSGAASRRARAKAAPVSPARATVARTGVAADLAKGKASPTASSASSRGARAVSVGVASGKEAAGKAPAVAVVAAAAPAAAMPPGVRPPGPRIPGTGGPAGLLKSSKFVGVHLSHKHLLLRPWLACCWAGGKNHHLGYFQTEEDAAKAYDTFARAHRKPLNFADARKGEEPATKQVKASRYRGVHFKKGNKTKPWKAVCVVGGRQYHLGYHHCEEAAAAAYDAFAQQHGRALNGVKPPPLVPLPAAATA
ncbi:hypothetical protein T492DRAFT_1009567 [Pavlovales sp. CCMP2436]|nr:hypothetical protein T492DRAFT_1009567 [Pavlovales sp. CCMP2436]|mmetsp:Transcript_32524/g.76004  ORF Transcript_32524/g.76004 Transcript_32524/m.76004 type:complete len:416 (-) Transcript_32524:266-1513(-)